MPTEDYNPCQIIIEYDFFEKMLIFQLTSWSSSYTFILTLLHTKEPEVTVGSSYLSVACQTSNISDVGIFLPYFKITFYEYNINVIINPDPGIKSTFSNRMVFKVTKLKIYSKHGIFLWDN